MKKKIKSKHIEAWIMAALCVLSMYSCSATSTDKTNDGVTSFVSSEDSIKVTGVTSFVFSEDSIKVTQGDYDGYDIDGSSLTINDSGTYIVSGKCDDGSIKIKKGTSDVTLIFNGLSLNSSDTAPLTIGKSSEVSVVVSSGTINALSDTEKNNAENYPDNVNAESAVIKCKDGSKVTLSGDGTLDITANAKNGIKSGATTIAEGEASLTIKEVTLNVTTPINDAINAEQLLSLESGNITVCAESDGIHCDYVMNVGKTGTSGPSITVKDSYEGLEAATLNIFSEKINIHSEDDCINAANSDLSGYNFSINISGGELYMDSEIGDGIDSNGDLSISGGNVTVWTANSSDNAPLDADGTLSVTGGVVLAAGGSAGMGMKLEAEQPYVIFGGTGSFGGFKNFSKSGGFAGGAAAPENESIPDASFGIGTSGGNKSEDGGQGGQNFTDGSQNDNVPYPPANVPSQISEQYEQNQASSGNSLPGGIGQTAYSQINISEGSAFSIKDESGNTVYSGTAAHTAGYIFFSSPELESEKSYTLYSETENVETSSAGTDSMSGGFAGGRSDVKHVNPQNGSEKVRPAFPSDENSFGDAMFPENVRKTAFHPMYLPTTDSSVQQTIILLWTYKLHVL